MPPDSPERTEGGVAHSASASQARVTKRSSNACTRCRRQKIKCSGQHPCKACSRRKLLCQFDDHEQKILITRGYLASLEQKIAALQGPQSRQGGAVAERSHEPRRRDNGVAGPTVINGQQDNTVEESNVFAGEQLNSQRDEPADEPAGAQRMRQQQSTASSGQEASIADSNALSVASLTNPITTDAVFVTSDSGRTYYLGTSSNWSFTRRMLNLTRQYVHCSLIPTDSLRFDGETYDLNYSDERRPPPKEAPAVPTVDYALHLVNAVKFHCGQVFHLFEESIFLRKLHEFYAEPRKEVARMGLWYIHFLLVLAFGKAFVTKTSRGRRPPGADFFCTAMKLLPESNLLWREPEEAAEILCCISLYYQCIDHRSSAYNHIGQALRLAMSQGMHTDKHPHQLNEESAQRWCKIWWTVYVLDREMTSLMGLPQALSDEHARASLPTFEGDSFRTAAFLMRINLSHFIVSIDRTVYAADGRLQRDFLLRTKRSLTGIAELTDKLQSQFSLVIDDHTSCISRLSAHLHLLYHQCIILATRPLLFCFYKIRLDSPASCSDLLDSSETARNMIQMCLDSSQQIITILTALCDQDLLETFLPFDLDALHTSATNIIVAALLLPDATTNFNIGIQKAFATFDHLTASGNLIAKAEQTELLQLQQLVQHVLATESSGPTEETALPAQAYSFENSNSYITTQLDHGLPVPNSGMDFGEDLLSAGFSTAQIMDMVNSINTDQNDWMSEEVIDRVFLS